MKNEMVSVIGLFDNEGTEKLRSYQEMLINEKSSLIDIPHLTFAVYDKPIALDDLINWVKHFCATHQQMIVNIGAVGVFNESNICVIPGLSKDLYKFHVDFQVKFDDKCREYLA